MHVGPLFLIGLGGFAGAVARYLLDARISAATGGGFPWGTLAINVSGSFAIGLLFALVTERAALPADWRAPLMIGFLGSYTTFSTLSLESWRMIENGAWLTAGGNLLGSLALGMVAVIGGVALGRAI
ncbi:MAG: fluoride efflux transporter CrcB [Candidatus Limnocylindria bacterium]